MTTLDLQGVAGHADATRLACASQRFQPYLQPHRQLRRALARALLWGSRLAAVEVEALLTLYAAHQDAEGRYLHAPLRQCAARATLAFDAEHEDQLAAIAALRALLPELTSDARPAGAAAHELELRLSQFIADGLAHMAEEETTVTRELWRHFSDAQLREFAESARAAVARAMADAPAHIQF